MYSTVCVYTGTQVLPVLYIQLYMYTYYMYMYVVPYLYYLGSWFDTNRSSYRVHTGVHIFMCTHICTTHIYIYMCTHMYLKYLN